jgi:ATP-dependent exoDNAse (exonuclease V) alpha subunit
LLLPIAALRWKILAGLRHDFSRKGGVSGSLTLAPTTLRLGASDPAQLWANVETIEKRKDAQLCRELTLPAPRTDPQQCATLGRAFVQKEFVDRGMCATIAFHHIGGDNPHFHLMTTMRDIDQDGFKIKTATGMTSNIDHWRAEWARYTNHALTLANSPARIDHRSLKAQGIDREPTQHQGPKAFVAMQSPWCGC